MDILNKKMATHSELIESVFTKVQKDLKRLRDEIQNASSSQNVDTGALDTAIERTQRELGNHAEQTMQQLQGQTALLPTISRQTGLGAKPKKGKSRRTISEMVQNYKSGKENGVLRRSVSENGPRPSPGEIVKSAYMEKLLAQPHNKASRQLISDRYGIPLSPVWNAPLQWTREVVPLAKPVTGPTTNHHSATSRRNEPLLSSIGQEDASRGLLSLAQRGLLPPTSEIVLDPSPVKPKPVRLHSPTHQHSKVRVADTLELKHFPLVKVDIREEVEKGPHLPKTTGGGPVSVSMVTAVASVNPAMTIPVAGPSPRPEAPPPTRSARSAPPPCPDQLHIAIHKGVIPEEEQDYQMLHTVYRSRWGNIVSLLHQLRVLACSYAIALIVVDGRKAADLAQKHPVTTKWTHKELLQCMVNSGDVEVLLALPGQRYKGVGGLHLAASRIQALFRMYQARKQYLQYRRSKWAAGVIAMGWLLHASRQRVRRRLAERRKEILQNFHKRSQQLKKNWSKVKSSRRVLIHLPSQGYSQSVRSKIDRFATFENSQISRIFDLLDEQVEIIYISPVEVPEELEQYCYKLLEMASEGHSAGCMKKRLTFVVPENLHKFTSLDLPLSTLLLHSPKALQRVRNLTRGKEAILVPGYVNQDDLAVADSLQVPLLASDHLTAQLYSSKHGAIKLFTEAEVDHPPTATDVYSEEQLVSSLAVLVASHLHISKWCIKLNGAIQGRGIAVCDMLAHLPCSSWLQKEQEWYGSKWNKKWAKETAVKRIADELPEVLKTHAKLPSAYKTWLEYMSALISRGGIIQGFPPSDSVTSLSVNLLLEPDGLVQLLSTADQINPRPFWKWGVSVPQCSVDPTHLNMAAMKMATSCLQRGIVGYLSIDFVTFISSLSMEQELWCVDVDVGLSDVQCMSQLMSYVTKGKFNSENGTFTTSLSDLNEARYAVLSSNLSHECMAFVEPSVFFHLCQAHLIGYDVKMKSGTVFTLPSFSDRTTFGMLSISSSLKEALQTMLDALSVIHQEITVTGRVNTNFKVVSSEIRRILTELTE